MTLRSCLLAGSHGRNETVGLVALKTSSRFRSASAFNSEAHLLADCAVRWSACIRSSRGVRLTCCQAAGAKGLALYSSHCFTACQFGAQRLPPKFEQGPPPEARGREPIPVTRLTDHVVLGRHGRVGSVVSEALPLHAASHFARADRRVFPSGDDNAESMSDIEPCLMPRVILAGLGVALAILPESKKRPFYS
jgi:hypothetical protein